MGSQQQSRTGRRRYHLSAKRLSRLKIYARRRHQKQEVSHFGNVEEEKIFEASIRNENEDRTEGTFISVERSFGSEQERSFENLDPYMDHDDHNEIGTKYADISLGRSIDNEQENRLENCDLHMDHNDGKENINEDVGVLVERNITHEKENTVEKAFEESHILAEDSATDYQGGRSGKDGHVLLMENVIANDQESRSEYHDLHVDSHVDSCTINETRIKGRSIVDISYMLNEIHAKFDNHFPALDCPFRDLKLIKSRRWGLKEQLFFKCQLCNFEDSIWTNSRDDDTMDINLCAVSGAITTGIGHSQMEEFLASMNIPCMSVRTYRKCDMALCEAFEKAAASEMKEAAEVAKKCALEKQDFIIHDGEKIPFITVVADCSWMKRSYGSGKYDSLSGVGAILDLHTGKVLYIGVRNKFCAVCEWAARHNVHAKDHVCYKNWGRDQASTGMESDALVEGFKCSIEMNGLIYKTLVADGDSNVYKSILDNNPYEKYNVLVEKKECVNHLLRNLARKVREIAKTKGRNISRQKQLVEHSVMKFRNGIEMAIRYRQQEVDVVERAEASPKHNTNAHTRDRIEHLKNDVLNMPCHVFGDHTKCRELKGFCDGIPVEGERNVVGDLKEAGLFNKLEEVLTYLSVHANSLLYCATNNIAEAYNAIICKLIGGKRVNFGMRGSYTARCSGAVLQCNTQNVLSKLHQSQGKQPPSKIIQLEIQRKRKIRNNAEIRRRQKELRSTCSKRKETCQGLDKNYGPHAEKPDLPAGLYDDLVVLHERRLLENEQNRVQIEIDTRGQAENALWQSLRRKLLTASNFGKVCRMLNTTSCSAAVRSMLYPSIKNTSAMIWGRTNETKAVKDFQKQMAQDGNPITVKPCGLFIDAEIPFLGASPDGITNDGGIVEIKCPKSAQNYTPDETIALRISEIPHFFDRNDATKMNASHHYFYQVQGQLHITQKEHCYFVVWCPKGLKYVKVMKDDEFWMNRMESYLTRFYKQCLLPEMIDSRYIRRMPIREPEYILEARRLKEAIMQEQKTITNISEKLVVSHARYAEEENVCIKLRKQISGDDESWIIVPRESPPVQRTLRKMLRKSAREQTVHASTEEYENIPPLKVSKVLVATSEESWIFTSSDEQSCLLKSKRNRRPPILPMEFIKQRSVNVSFKASSSSDEQSNRLKHPVYCLSPQESEKPTKKQVSWITVPDNDCLQSVTESEREIFEAVYKNVPMAEIRVDVVASNSLLNDTSIQYFLDIIKCTSGFCTGCPLWLAYPRFIKPLAMPQDIQIIGGNTFRHWRCFYFDGVMLNIYDSLLNGDYSCLKPEEKTYIRLRYPNLRIENVIFRTVQKQPDNYSCGVYAAAFATTIALGGNPSDENYSNDIVKMRKHFLSILETKQLSAFPCN